MEGQKTAEAITAALWRVILDRGWGAVKRTEKAMGLHKDGLRHAKHRDGGLRLKEVTNALEVLGIPPAVFFNDALGGVSTTAGERFMARGADLAARKLVDLPELADDDKPDRLTEDDLARLDAARFEDPRAAAEQAAGVARQAASDGRRGDAAAAVARQGSALRVAEMWEPAWVCVWWALRHAPDGPIKADAWLRSISISSDLGEFENAAELARTAASEHWEAGSMVGIGKSLVLRGVSLRKSGVLEEAIRLLNAALSFFPDNDKPAHFAIHRSLGLAYLSLGNIEAAELHAREAQEIPELAPAFVIDLRWLQARIAAAREDTSFAIRLYRETVVALEQSPGTAALASTELCRLYLTSGRPAEASATAIGMARLAIPMQQNYVVAGAIADLYCVAQKGMLTLRTIDLAIARIRKGTNRRAITTSQRAANKTVFP